MVISSGVTVSRKGTNASSLTVESESGYDQWAVVIAFGFTVTQEKSTCIKIMLILQGYTVYSQANSVQRCQDCQRSHNLTDIKSPFCTRKDRVLPQKRVKDIHL